MLSTNPYFTIATLGLVPFSWSWNESSSPLLDGYSPTSAVQQGGSFPTCHSQKVSHPRISHMTLLQGVRNQATLNLKQYFNKSLFTHQELKVASHLHHYSWSLPSSAGCLCAPLVFNGPDRPHLGAPTPHAFAWCLDLIHPLVVHGAVGGCISSMWLFNWASVCLYCSGWEHCPAVTTLISQLALPCTVALFLHSLTQRSML